MIGGRSVISLAAAISSVSMLSTPSMGAAQQGEGSCPEVSDADGHGPDIDSEEYEAACQFQSDIAAIRAHGESWKTLYEAGDFDAMEALYAPNAILMTQGAPMRSGPDAIIGAFRESYAAGYRATIDFEEERIDVNGDRADLIALYWMTITPPEGDPIEAFGRSWLTFVRADDGTWLLWRDMDNNPTDVTLADRPDDEDTD